MGIYDEILKQPANDSNLCGLGLGEAAAAAKAKRIHQRILKRLCTYIDNVVMPQYEAINEGEIGGTNTDIPDIVVWSLNYQYETKDPLLAIEITTTDEQQNVIDKIARLFAKYNTLQECFVFNYNTNKWLQVFADGTTKENSKSKLIEFIAQKDCDLNAPLKNCDINHLFGLQQKRRKTK